MQIDGRCSSSIKDEYRDGMKIRHGGCSEVHEKMPLKRYLK